jgi:DNA replication protein DnaC
MQAVALSACSLGYRVLYTSSAQMLLQLTAALADKSLTETLKYYAKWDLLLVDEFGFDRIEREDSPQAAHLLYKVVHSRHQKRSTILITNVDFDAWAAYLGDAPLAMAMLDRLVDGAILIKIKGPSYRARRSPKTND